MRVKEWIGNMLGGLIVVIILVLSLYIIYSLAEAFWRIVG
jgi:hypothetical protein